MSFLQWWNQRSGDQQLAIGAGSVLFLAAIVAAAVFAFRPSYEVLVGGLGAEEVATVTTQLSKASIEYRLEAKEGNVLVRRDDILGARNRLAEEGLPLKGPQGFELFDNAEFGMTEFAQRINFQRALEGELTRTIVALDEVSRARLHLVLPEQGLFKRSDETPKASLMLVLKDRVSLTPARVRGIQDLVASSVPGMRAENVTIHDHRGVSLSPGAEGSGPAQGIDGRLDAKRSMELYLAAKAEEALRNAFPNDHVAVIVDADLDLDRRHVERDETSSALRSAGLFSMSTSLSKSGSADENSTATRAAPAEPTRSVNEHVTESIDVASGAIRRLTVAILVPSSSAGATREALIELVRNAIGADAARGDRISIMDTDRNAWLPEAPDGISAVGGPTLDDGLVVNGSVISSKTLTGWAVVGLGVLSLFALIGFGIGRRLAVRPMTPQERHQALTELRQWIETSQRPEGT